jgi:hypothetical protein
MVIAAGASGIRERVNDERCRNPSHISPHRRHERLLEEVVEGKRRHVTDTSAADPADLPAIRTGGNRSDQRSAAPVRRTRRQEMRAFITGWRMMLALAGGVLALGAAAATASADGLTAAQLQAHGWACRIPAGETLLNCRSPGTEPLPAGPTEVNFLVFDASGSTFLGTEHVIRSDLYGGQPCEGTPIGTYEFIPVGPGYYACYHFSLP